MNIKIVKTGRQFLYIFILVMLLFCFTIPIVQAKQTGIKVSPLRSRPTVKPGQSTTASLEITNDTSSAQKLTLTTEQFGVTNEEYDYSFSKSGAASWVQFVDKSIELAPGKSRKVAYSLEVPTNAIPGGHYISLLVSTSNQKNNNTINEVYRVASLIYLEVSGKITKKSTLTSFDTAWLSTSNKLPYTIRIANQGNSHFEARTLVKARSIPITNAQYSTQNKGLMLPGTIRKLQGTLNIGQLPGLYTVSATFSPPEGGTQILQRRFLFIPWWFGVILVVSLLTLTKATMSKIKKRKSSVRLRDSSVDN